MTDEYGVCENCSCITVKHQLTMHYIEYMCEDCMNAFDKGVFFADMNRPKSVGPQPK